MFFSADPSGERYRVRYCTLKAKHTLYAYTVSVYKYILYFRNTLETSRYANLRLWRYKLFLVYVGFSHWIPIFSDAMRVVLENSANAAQSKLAVKTWMLSAERRTAQRSAVTTEIVSVASVCVRRGKIPMRSTPGNTVTATISIVIVPMD